MILAMAGFDYTTSALEKREQLALTKTEIKEMLSSVSARTDVEGCVYVSTCGRGELYLFCGETLDVPGLLEEFFRGRIDGTDMSFRARAGRDTVDHLFHLACGMRSQIYGEDQILAQLKQSLELAREARTVSGVLDRLFLSAITAAKKVKSTVRLTAVNASVADRMLAILGSRTQIRGKHCLVIGNGEIGRLCAAKLLEAGAKVTVTVRNYRTREVVIPVGCRIIDYRERFRVLPEVDVIVSATTSPHFTLPYSEDPLLSDGHERWLFDLALPRDIAPEYGKIPGIHLYGLDEVSGGASERQTEADAQAEEILKKEEGAFFRWLDFRAVNRQAMHVGELAAGDVTERVHKRVHRVLEGEMLSQTEQIELIYADAVKKVVDNLMYDLRSQIPEEQYKALVSAMEQSAVMRSSCGDGWGKVQGVPEIPGETEIPKEQRTLKFPEETKVPKERRTLKFPEETEVPKERRTLKFPEETEVPKEQKTPEFPKEKTIQKLREPSGMQEAAALISYFPLFLDTRKKTVLIYGAGKISLRRTKKLLDFACEIHVIAPEAEEELLCLAEQCPQRIRYERKSFAEEELIQCLSDQEILFVVAATDDREVNRAIGDLCRARNMPVSVADRKEESSCYFPGIAVGTMRDDGEEIAAGISSDREGAKNAAETSLDGEGAKNVAGISSDGEGAKNAAGISSDGDGAKIVAGISSDGESAKIVAGISSEGADHCRTARAVRKITALLEGKDDATFLT